jgi:hypothetical protein
MAAENYGEDRLEQRIGMMGKVTRIFFYPEAEPRKTLYITVPQ